MKTLTIKLKERNYTEVSGTIEPGDIVIWEKLTFPDGTENEHIGFALGNDEAISTSSTLREVATHHVTYGKDDAGNPNRNIAMVYRPTYTS